MTIGTSLFHTNNARSLSQINERIAGLQDQISSGKNDPRPSSDPVRALRLSAAQEQRTALDRFSTNLDRAQARLDQADTVLEEAVNIMRRTGELSLRAASDTVTNSERTSIAAEVKQLRESLLGMANSRDDTGAALFGGYMTQTDPFQDGIYGVSYQGDGGQARLQVSESTSLPTALSGEEVFQAVPGDDGGDVFAIIDDFLATLSAAGQGLADSATASGTLALAPALTPAPADWTMTLSGPMGSATISVTAATGALSGAVDAVNAQTAATGISATLDSATGELVLSAAGEMTVSGVSADPAPQLAPGQPLMTATDSDGAEQALIPTHRTADAAIGRLQAATDHLIDQRTRLGALSASASTQATVIETRKVAMETTLSGLQDLDLTDALTRLQEAMLTRDATQQVYAKIIQKNLFDYLR